MPPDGHDRVVSLEGDRKGRAGQGEKKGGALEFLNGVPVLIDQPLGDFKSGRRVRERGKRDASLQGGGIDF